MQKLVFDLDDMVALYVVLEGITEKIGCDELSDNEDKIGQSLVRIKEQLHKFLEETVKNEILKSGVGVTIQ